MLTTKEYLTLINERGRQRKPLKRVFSNILKRPELFVNAVAKIAPNKGAGTPGVDGQTIDGTSLAKVNELIGELRHKTFRWTPVRREYIPKGKGATRPIRSYKKFYGWFLKRTMNHNSIVTRTGSGQKEAVIRP